MKAPDGFGMWDAASSAATPPTIITSVAVTHWWRADLGITLAGGNVSAWADQITAFPLTQGTAIKQPPYTAADPTLSGLATMAFDGVDDVLSAPANPAGPIFIAIIAKLLVPSGTSIPFYSNQGAFGGDGNYLQIYGVDVYQAAMAFNANVDLGGASALNGNWARIQDKRANSATDYIKCGNRPKRTGIACPTSGGAGTWGVAGASVAGVYMKVAYREIVMCAGEPSAAELAALDAYFLAQSPGILV